MNSIYELDRRHLRDTMAQEPIPWNLGNDEDIPQPLSYALPPDWNADDASNSSSIESDDEKPDWLPEQSDEEEEEENVKSNIKRPSIRRSAIRKITHKDLVKRQESKETRQREASKKLNKGNFINCAKNNTKVSSFELA